MKSNAEKRFASVETSEAMQSAQEIYKKKRIAHWDNVARQLNDKRRLSTFYRSRLAQLYRFSVASGQRVLEIGCGLGDLLAYLEPAFGTGLDFSAEMIKRAKKRHPHLSFMECDAHELNLNEKFDVVVLSDVINDLWDVQTVFESMRQFCTVRSRIILNFYNGLWAPPLALGQRLGIVTPALLQNWLSLSDVEHLLDLAGFEIVRESREFLCPFPIRFLNPLFNKFLVKIWPLTLVALTNFVIARLKASDEPATEYPKVSVIVPARNEAGNISKIPNRVPRMGRETEIIFVEGHSTDNTYAEIKKTVANHPEWSCRLIQQSGSGKGDAVRSGFAAARGDILIILDADLTVLPEDLPRFYDALRTGKGEFINGVRLIYSMEKMSMRFFNLLGNKFFSLVFTWLLGQSIKDTLCGTKVLWKSDYELIAANRYHFGDFDPFGDFDLLFGANKLGLKIIDLPIRYQERTYGTTNIQRWKHGWLLLKMVLFAAKKIKFV